MPRPKKNQGRLPESMSLSLGLHALLLLIPLGALIQSEGEVEGRTRVQLIDLKENNGPVNGRLKPQPNPDDLLQSLMDGAENEALVLPGQAPENALQLNDLPSVFEPTEQDTELLEPPNSSEEGLKKSEATANDEPSIAREPRPETDQAVVPEGLSDQSDAPDEGNLKELKPTPQLEDQPAPTEITLFDVPTDPDPKPEEVVDEEEERDEPDTTMAPREFARAPSRGPESEPPSNTSRISDQNMRVDEELRAAVHSTEEGSAELGVTGSTASSGRPAPPGSQPAGRQGQSGEDDRNGQDRSSESTIAEQLEHAGDSNEGSDSEASSPSLREDEENSAGRTGQPAQPGSVIGRAAAAGSPGQEGYRVPQAVDGDIAALLAARRGTQGQAGLESRAQAGLPYRPSLATPSSDRNGNRAQAHAAEQSADQASDSQTASGDGLAEAGERDGLHPEAAQYRQGAPSGGASIASPGASDRSATAPLTVADLSIQLDDVTRLNARATPLGVYISTIEDQIRKAWVLPVEYRAMGTQGVAEVSFVVSRNGRVSQAKIVRKSGTDGLDRLALQSIPRWFPRIPEEIDRRQIRFSYVFRATDSIVSDTVNSE